MGVYHIGDERWQLHINLAKLTPESGHDILGGIGPLRPGSATLSDPPNWRHSDVRYSRPCVSGTGSRS